MPVSSADYKIEAEVSTSSAVKNLREMRTAASQLTGTLRELNKVTATGEKNLSSYAASVSKIIASQSQAATATTKLAQARLQDARAAGQQQQNTQRAAESQARQGLTLARTGEAVARAQRTMVAGQNETLRTQSAVELQAARTAAATDRAAQATQRHGWAAQRAARNQLELTDNLSNTRYLLYDVGATYRTMAIGLEALPIATGVVAAAYQKDFAQVIRVTQGTQIANDELRQSMKDMATDIPTSFSDLSKIATLGAQVGIDDTSGLEHLTDTVAKFTASVDGVPIETATLAFGRMKDAFSGIDKTDAPGYFNKLGSAMAVVGARTAATDSEIVSMLNQIGPLGAEAGFTSAQIVGLAGALSSVRVQPELARGTLTRVFAGLNRAADEGAAGMADWGRALNMSGEAAANMWKKNPDQFWTAFIQKLNEVHKSGGNLTAVFDDLGIKASRDVSALTKLGVGYDVLVKSQTAANQGFSEGTALNEMSAPVFETVAAKIQLLGNALQNLADSLGKGGLAPLAGFLGMLTDTVKWVTQLADAAPAVKILINSFLGLSAVAGVLLGLKAAQAFILAGMISMQQAMGSSAARTLNLTGLFRQFTVMILMSKGATEQQANALVRSTSAMGAYRLAMSSTRATVEATANSTRGLTAANLRAANSAQGFGTRMRAVAASMSSLVGGLPGLITMVGVGLVGALVAADQAAKDAGRSIAEAFQQGQSEGMKAVIDSLKNTKLGGGDTPLVGEWGKSIAELADRSGMDMARVVNALSKGKAGVQEFRKEIMQVARDRGATIIGDKLIGAVGTWEGDTAVVLDKLDAMGSASDSAASSTKKLGDVAKQTGADTAGAAGNFDDAGDSVKDLDQKLKDLNDTIFGTVNAEAAVGNAMNKLGSSLQASGSFGNNEAGRENVSNFQDSLAAAQKYYAQMRQAGQISREQAAQGYADFVDQLIAQTQAMGGQLGPIQDLALQTVGTFRSTIGATVATAPPTIPVQVDSTQVQQKALTAGQEVAAVLAGQTPTVRLFADDTMIRTGVDALAKDLATLTGQPYQVVLDALTDPANENAAKMQQYITEIVNGTYQAAVNADTTAATTNVKNFYNYAVSQLATLQSAINSIAASGAPGLAKYIGQSKGITPGQGVPYKAGGYNFAPAAAAPAQVAAKPVASGAGAPMPALGNMAQGYDKAADKADKAAKSADKAGKAGSKGGKDTANAWKDAGNAIDEATSNADDFANRLKQGLDRAFEKQYGLQQATDEYHKQLNDITKKREDELKQVDDLRQKIRDLNNERAKDLIDAGKAKTEQGISLKYGETARAADYGQQAQTALGNAASKQRDIDAAKKEAAAIQDGIGKLDGYSDAAIANREALRSLEQKQLDMVVAYAKTGASIDEVRNYAAGLNSQFQSDVGQIGFNQAAVQNLTGDLGRYIDVINRIPYLKPTEVTADVGTSDGAGGGTGALGDLGAFNAAADWAARDREMKIGVEWEPGSAVEIKDYKLNGQQVYSVRDSGGNVLGPKRVFNKGGVVPGYASGGSIVPGRAPSNPNVDNMLALVDGKRPVGLRSGEGIVNVPAMNYYGGAPFLDSLNKMRLPRFAFGGVPGGGRSGGSGSSGPVLVELTAEQLAAVINGVSTEVKFMVDSREIARASNRGNRELQKEGAR